MKKVVLTMAAILSIGAATGFAAPINNLAKGQTAIGFMDDSIYAEHKIADNVTIGLQRDNVYGQFHLNNNLRAIVGNDGSKMYIGAAVNSSLAPSLDGYASIIGASGYKELQVGANYSLTKNLDLNINYQSYMPDHGSNSNRTAVGASVKF